MEKIAEHGPNATLKPGMTLALPINVGEKRAGPTILRFYDRPFPSKKYPGNSWEEMGRYICK